MKVNVAVVGATGVVGRTFLKVLSERNFPVGNLTLFASKKSAGSKIEFCDKQYTVQELTPSAVSSCDAEYALFSAGAGVSAEYAPLFARRGITVIDNSSKWRMDPDVPLVVPEVNPSAALLNHGIIANPNCSTIQAVVALKPLHDAFKIKRVVYTTYQAVSGAGSNGLYDLNEWREGEQLKKFPYPIRNNIIPHIDVFDTDGYTKEELKMINETRKILGDDSLRVTATTARVPVAYGHSESINVEFFNPVTREAAISVLSRAAGVTVVDNPARSLYPMPIIAEGKDDVFVGRVRVDRSVEHGLNLWVVADNIRKGAATNAVQIAELLLKAK